MAPALSFVIPLYNSAETIASLVHEIEALSIEGGHEIVLVDDGSADATAAICRELVHGSRLPVTLVEHARNFGEHNAVLTGWRHARGGHIVNLDDDGQNPPEEAVRLWRHATAAGLDVVFGHYEIKFHSFWRNAGSRLTTRMTNWALDKPQGFYLSSFRCVSAFAARQVAAYSGPYPYLDGLLLQVTQRIGSIVVRHAERQAGASGYTLRRLVRLWLSAWLNFSVLPLRVATAKARHSLIVAQLSAVADHGRRPQVLAFLREHFGEPDVADIADPLGTVQARTRFGIVMLPGAMPAFIVDIGMRMLDPETELARAMGWPASYRLSVDANGARVTKTTITKLVGNGVCKHWAEAHVAANCADLPWWAEPGRIAA